MEYTTLQREFEGPSYCKIKEQCKIFRGGVQPVGNYAEKDRDEYVFLNERGVEDSTVYRETPCVIGKRVLRNNQQCKSVLGDICLENAYVSSDPRLKDPTRSIQMVLDKPPGEVRYDLINDNMDRNPKLTRYGKDYKGYSSVNAGEIQYYVNKDTAHPFYSPVYDVKSKSMGYMFVDPMGSERMQFVRDVRPEPYSKLSWLNDSAKFREDIISSQQRTHNEQRYENFYLDN